MLKLLCSPPSSSIVFPVRVSIRNILCPHLSTEYDDQKVSKVSGAYGRHVHKLCICIVYTKKHTHTRYHLRILNDLTKSFAMNNKWRVYFLQSKINRFKSVSLFHFKKFLPTFFHYIILFVPKAYIEWKNKKKKKSYKLYCDMIPSNRSD